MRFKLQTLADVTETNARREDGKLEYKQHQNFLTLMQTLALRSNIEVVETSITQESVGKMFGSNFKGKQNVWTLVFDLERDDSNSVEDMMQDLHLVPFIANLNETAKFTVPAFHLQESADLNTKITSM